VDGKASVTLSWAPPANLDGRTLLGYQVNYYGYKKEDDVMVRSCLRDTMSDEIIHLLFSPALVEETGSRH
jgi:hypothetical protein